MTLPTDVLAVPEAPITYDLSKPLTATESFRPGQVIFYETAFITSTGSSVLEGHHDEECEDEECDGCVEVANLDEDEVPQVNDEVVDDFDVLMSYCETTEALAIVDVRKHLFKLFRLYELDSTSLHELLHLPVAADQAPAFLDAAIGLRAAHPNVVPLGLSENDVAHLIGVLNKYCIPLDEVHAGDSLWVTAIAPIAAGDVVTVDFFNLHYQPHADRHAVLSEADYECHCALCLGHAPDKTRAFNCVACADGIVHPTLDVYACSLCDAVWDNDLVERATAEEAILMDELEVFTAISLREIVAASLLHPFHHIFYATCSNLMNDSIDDTLTPEHALLVYKELLDSLNYVVPYPHASKIQLMNLMAQTSVGVGRIETARAHYEAAHAMSCLVFGSTCGETRLFGQLAEHTPTSVDEMAAIYGFEEDDEEEEEEDPADPSSHHTIENV
ncbi:hypothetical protein DYB35_002605 [Aphanomyces astaci]|uniref:SET domain-containing protein n=2 Tax=Aphanomyces astaci TaxID=112090 RepID=A0A418DIN7_APHAT|nr:hypothetical protein DYB35_002605 [Aphanomyces astaci]